MLALAEKAAEHGLVNYIVVGENVRVRDERFADIVCVCWR